MRFDIVGSIILTLICMLICNFLHLGFFGSIILMILMFAAMNYRGRIKGYLYNVRQLFVKEPKKVVMKSAYERLDIE